MKKFKLFLVFSSILSLVLLYPVSSVLAADASSSSNLQSQLNILKTEIASKAAQIKAQIGKKVENRLVVGLVQSKTDDKITLTSSGQNNNLNDYDPNANKTLTVLINKFTSYSYLGKQIKSVSQDDYVVALGDLDDKDNLVAKDIVKQDPPDNTPIVYFWGKVTEASSSAMAMAGKDKNQNVLFSKNTSFQTGDKDASVKSLSLGETVIAAGPIDPKTQNLIAQFVYIFPKISTPSPQASQSASPSATSKVK